MGFLSVLRKLRNPTSRSSLPPALFPARVHAVSVTEWADSIQDMAENQECRLRRIVHCETKSASRHEFLLVYVRHPSGKDAVLLADRDTSYGGGDTDEDATAYPPRERRARGPVSSRDRVRLSSDGTEASLAGHVPGGWTAVHTVTFRSASEAPSVAHLAVLLTAVGRHVLSPGASAQVRSGWFAYCVAEVMKEIFMGRAKGDRRRVRSPYGGFPVQVDGRDTVAALIREFQSAWVEVSRRGPTTERTSKRHEEKKQAEMDSFADMLRTMNI